MAVLERHLARRADAISTDPYVIWALCSLYATALVAVVVSLIEQSLPIAVFVFAALVIGVVVCSRWQGDAWPTLLLFSVSYLVRLIASSLSWFAENGHMGWIARFAPDGQGYFQLSQLPLAVSLDNSNAPGWVVLNHYATECSDRLGGPHPLANLQMQILAGSLVASVLYMFAKSIGLRRTGWYASWLVSLQPMFVAYSSALIRDEVISVVGMATLLGAVRSVGYRRGKFKRWMLVVAGILFLVTLRVPSAVYFAAACAVLVLSTRIRSRRAFKKLAMFVLVAGLTVAVAVETNVFQFLGGHRFAMQTIIRQNAPMPTSSITQEHVETGGASWLVAGVALHFIAPFPFFRMFGDPKAGFLHYWVGVGALVNQCLLGFLLAGVAIALYRRNRILIASFAVAITFAVGSTLTFGDQARYMTAHAGPLLALLTIYGIRRSGQYRFILSFVWIVLLVLMHVGYFVVKARSGA